MAQPSNPTGTQALLRVVRRRMGLVRFARSAYVGLLGAAAAYLALWLAIRLTGLIPDFLTPITLPTVPAAGVLYALFVFRRPTATEAAHRTDEHQRSKDLFLTATLIDDTPGQFQPLVLRDAEAQATQARPEAVTPLVFWPKLGNAVAAMAVLLLLVLVPLQLDPFSSGEQRARLAERREQIRKERQVTIRRASHLQKKDLDAENTKLVEAKLNELKKNFDAMKPEDPTGNLKRLSEQQKAIEDEWRKAGEKKLRDALASKSTSQRFGGGASSQSRQWKSELKQGNPAGARKKIEELKQKAKELAETQDPQKQQQLRKELKQGLDELAQLAAEDPNAQALAAAVSRAMQQLDMSALEGLSAESLQALAESLDLSQLELQSLAQTMRDVQSMQQALQAMQTARLLNQLQPLDGSQCQGCNGMAQYLVLYDQMLSQCQGQGMGMGQGSGSGGGMGGPGRGRGNIAPEDPTAQSNFKTERSQSALTAGKMLMTWKTKEVSEAGEAKKDYRAAVTDVKQGVSEAMLTEQIPPGYHDGIQQYFDSIDEAVESTDDQ